MQLHALCKFFNTSPDFMMGYTQCYMSENSGIAIRFVSTKIMEKDIDLSLETIEEIQKIMDSILKIVDKSKNE